MDHRQEDYSAGATSRQTQLRPHEIDDAIAELRDMGQRIEVLSERLGAIRRGSEPAAGREIEPEVDIFETDQEFLIHAHVSGVPPSDISVEVTPQSVQLVAHPRSVGEADGAGQAKRLRFSRYAGCGKVRFACTLDCAVMPDAARAVFRHGIVEIRLPKAPLAQIVVSVPVSAYEPAEQTVPPRLESVALAAEVAVVSAHEGSPRHKLGAVYAPNPAEDHAAKARSVGETGTPA